jgi:tol-pal system protein YbgF
MLRNRRHIEHSAMTRLLTRGLTAAALAAGLSVVSTVALSQDGPFNPLDRLFGNRPSADVEQSREQGPTTEQVLRIEQLEAKIRQMTGTIEQLQYRNQQLETQIRSMGGNAAAGQPMPQPGASQQAMQPPPTSQPPMQRPAMEAQPMRPMQQSAVSPSSPSPSGRRADVFDPSQNPSAPGAPRPLGSMPVEPPPPVITADTPVGAPGGRGVGAPLDLSTLSGPRGSSPPPASSQGGLLPAPPSRNPSATGAVAAVAPSSESPQGFYDLGYGYVLRKDYALAEQTFQLFLSKYPNDRRAPDAQFWLGESQFQRQQYDAAAQSFLDLSTKHGTHAKAPEALLRLAQSLAALKQKEMSCATLAEVGRKYPKAPTSVRQAVEREQKRVQC